MFLFYHQYSLMKFDSFSKINNDIIDYNNVKLEN
jgi:hypothetical protein